MENNIKRVLVADDHSLFRRGIVGLLEAAEYEVVDQVSDGVMAVESARQLCPDLVLLDITMPKMSGLEALKIIKNELPETFVVMLTVSEEDSDLLAAIKNGANGYLMKDLNYHDFIDMLTGLERGEAAITRKTTNRLMIGFANHDKHTSSSLPNVRLTPREIDLLECVSKGFSNKAISQSLSISDNTVKYHLRNILQKLNAQNRTEAVTLAIKMGLLASP
jgi:two-component system nitrate/nitrite response regulator NarL